MNPKYKQTYICAITPNCSKLYLAVGETKLQMQDLESYFTNTPTAAITKALDGLKPKMFAWVELERTKENRFDSNSWCISAAGTHLQETCQMGGRDMLIGRLVDILTDEIKEEQI